MNKDIENILNELPENIAMNTKIWGPPTWFFLHSMVMAYPKEIDSNDENHIRIRNSMFQFLSNLGNVLPCPLCGNSYNSYLKDPELPSLIESLKSRKSLVYFMYQIHNRVNDKLGVPLCERPSLKEVIECYSNYIANKQMPTTEEERINRRMKGCENTKKKFSCKVSVFDNKNSKESNNDLHYLNIKKSEFTNLNEDNSENDIGNNKYQDRKDSQNGEDRQNGKDSQNVKEGNTMLIILLIIITLAFLILLYMYLRKTK